MATACTTKTGKLYKEFKILRSNPTITKTYVSDKSNLTLLIQVRKFESEDAANKVAILTQKIFNITFSSGNVTVERIDDNFFKIYYENETFYVKFGHVNNFSYSIRLTGHDTTLMKNIIERQELKLMKK